MCGHDLRIQPRRRPRVALVDVLMVMAVLAVLLLWWRIGVQPQPEPTAVVEGQTILPTGVPLLAGTLTPTPTAAPTATPTPAPTQPPQQVTLRHRVQAGETLSEIADEYGVTVEEIQTANSLSDELIREGDELLIPVLRTVAPTPAGPISRPEYVVQADDTIVSIATKFGSSVEQILAANNLTEADFIRPGDVLVIPMPELPPAVVESGATTPTQTPPVSSSDASTIYIEPRLLGPPDGVTLARDEVILLRWISVDVLQPNEWYVVLVEPDSDLTARLIPSIWTKLTSHRLTTDLAPESGQQARYRWRVAVVRVKTGATGQLVLEAASPPSLERHFTWQ
jgi:LysM repeat protein